MNLRYNFKYNNLTTINNGGVHTLRYESSKPNALTTHEFENSVYDMPGSSILNHNYTYTAFDKIASIDQDGPSAMNITYGVDQQRIKMEVIEGGSLTIDKYYVGSANMEITNGTEYTYLYAEGKPFAIYKSNTDELFYLHLDYQGSLMAITTHIGDIIENRSGVYAERSRSNAWGRSRDPNTWEYSTNVIFGGSGSGITMRGYTMHEHLEMFNLINMPVLLSAGNGRVYDPLLARFLNADPFIQDNTDAQNYNRYSYVLNNPTKYTDPSGYVYTNYDMQQRIQEESQRNFNHDLMESVEGNYQRLKQQVEGEVFGGRGGASGTGNPSGIEGNGYAEGDNDPVDPPIGNNSNILPNFPTTILGAANMKTSGTVTNCNHRCGTPNTDGWGVYKESTTPRQAGAFAFSADAAWGGGYSYSLGVVWDSKGQYKFFQSYGPVIGITLSAGFSSRTIKSNNGIPFSLNDYKGFGNSHSWGVLFYGRSYSGNKGDRLKPIEALKYSKGLSYDETSNGIFWGGKFGFSWSRTKTLFFD